MENDIITIDLYEELFNKYIKGNNLLSKDTKFIDDSIELLKEKNCLCSPILCFGGEDYIIKKELLLLLLDSFERIYKECSKVHFEYEEKITNLFKYKFVLKEKQIEFISKEIERKFELIENNLGFRVSYDIEQTLHDNLLSYILTTQPHFLICGCTMPELHSQTESRLIIEQIKTISEINFLKKELESKEIHNNENSKNVTNLFEDIEPLSNNPQKIILLDKLGIIGLIKEKCKVDNSFNNTQIGKVIELITGMNKGTARKHIEALLNEQTDNKNHPYKNDINVEEVDLKLKKLRIN